MRLRKSFQLALNILLHSKLRSWLTIIGIVIGIAAVVSIISISEGAQQQLQSRLAGLGANILTVMPGLRGPEDLEGILGVAEREEEHHWIKRILLQKIYLF